MHGCLKVRLLIDQCFVLFLVDRYGAALDETYTQRTLTKTYEPGDVCLCDACVHGPVPTVKGSNKPVTRECMLG